MVRSFLKGLIRTDDLQKCSHQSKIFYEGFLRNFQKAFYKKTYISPIVGGRV